jgi:hypothetical protein
MAVQEAPFVQSQLLSGSMEKSENCGEAVSNANYDVIS